ncbi:hypothetical protein BB029_21250 [Pseudomonas sp. S3E12]|nr:hypothetical protein BB029_21250 [Pseudomonas sp. S3E12]
MLPGIHRPAPMALSLHRAGKAIPATIDGLDKAFVSAKMLAQRINATGQRLLGDLPLRPDQLQQAVLGHQYTARDQQQPQNMQLLGWQLDIAAVSGQATIAMQRPPGKEQGSRRQFIINDGHIYLDIRLLTLKPLFSSTGPCAHITTIKNRLAGHARKKPIQPTIFSNTL